MDLTILISMFLFIMRTTGLSFPENKQPIRKISFNELSTTPVTGAKNGDKLTGLHLIKSMRIAGKQMVVIGARAKIIMLDPSKFSATNEDSTSVVPELTYTWAADNKTKAVCAMKGQSENDCDNYIRVIEATDKSGNNLLICGTNAYDPVCKKFEAQWGSDGVLVLTADETFVLPGKEKCPFGPDQSGSSLFSGETLYSSTVTDFSGRSSVVSRSSENEEEPSLKTSRYDTKVLNEPTFIEMRDDEDRVYVFMNEMVENDYGDVRMMSKVAQVCKNDQGGEHVLVRQWTTFIKTRLNCSYHGYYFDQLQDVSQTMKVSTEEGVVEMMFATFTSPEFAAPASAVCAFTIDAIRDAMQSGFKTDNNVVSSVGTLTPPTGDRHPGSCSGEKLTDTELQFIKSHPVLEKQISGSLISTESSHRWTAIAVDSKAGPREDYTVLFVGTTEGNLIRYLSPDDKVKYGTPISEQDVYDTKQCGSKGNRSVMKIILHKERKVLSIAFESCVVVVPLQTCEAHLTEESCMLSADPYCGWDGKSCIEYTQRHQKFRQNLPFAANNPVVIVPAVPESTKDKSTVNIVEDVRFYNDEKQSDDAEVILEKMEEDLGKDEAPNSGKDCDKNIAVAGFISSSDECVSTVLIIVISIIVFIASGILFGFLGCYFGRRASRNPGMKNDDENVFDSKISLKAKLQKSTNIINNFSPNRNRKNQKMNNTPSTTPLVPQKNSTSSYHESSMVKSETLNNTLLRQQNSKNRDSRYSSVSSNGPPRYSQIRPTSRTSANVHCHSPQDTCENTLPRSVADADTLQYPDSHKKLGSRHSSPPVSIQDLNTKKSSMNTIERRQKASDQTNEIMRDSNSIMMDTEESLKAMLNRSENNGVLDDGRTRLDSDDSGKGDSPRNSMQTEEEKNIKSMPPPIPSPSNKPTRPHSLPTGQNKRRTRLNSEPTMELSSPSGYHHKVSRNAPQRTNSMLVQPRLPPHYATTQRQSSQPSTPSKLKVFNPGHPQQNYQNTNIYSTLPKNHNMMQKGPYPPHVYSKPSQNPRYVNNNNNMQPMQYDKYNMHDRFSSLPLRSNAHRSKGNIGQAYSVQPNRNSNGSDYSNVYPAHNPVTRQSSQPSHFPTLQHTRNNTPTSMASVPERSSTLHRRETLPSIMRQTSNQTNPVFVPLPTVPDTISSHGESLNNNVAV